MILRTLITIGWAFLLPAFVNGQHPDQEQMREFAKRNQQRLLDQMLINQLMQLGSSRALQAELEVVKEQAERLTHLARSFNSRMMKFSSENLEQIQEAAELIRSGEHAEGMKLSNQFHELQSEIMNEMMDEVNEVLLPHQVDRLRQLAKQQMARTTNPYRDEFGIAIGLAEELELTREERTHLSKTIERVRKQYYADVAELKKQANQEIMDAIPPAKRERIKEILGDYYDRETQSRKQAAKMRKEMESRRQEAEQPKREEEEDRE